eukprot:s133_g18.t1
MARCWQVELPTKSWQYPQGGIAMQRPTLSTLEAEADAWGVWAWTGGAAAAVMDLEWRGVGGGTVATAIWHLSTYLACMMEIEILVALQPQLLCQ